MEVFETVEVGVAVMFLVTMLRAWIPRAERYVDGDRVFALVFAAALFYAVIAIGEPSGWRDIGFDPQSVRAAIAIAVTAVGANVVLGRARSRIPGTAE